MKKEDICLYLKELGINDNAGELSELVEKLSEQECKFNYEANFFERLDEIGLDENPKPLTGNLYETPDYYGEYYPYVVLSPKGWPLHFGWTLAPDCIEQNIHNKGNRFSEIKVYNKGVSRKIAEDWITGQINSFKDLYGCEPYLQDKVEF